MLLLPYLPVGMGVSLGRLKAASDETTAEDKLLHSQHCRLHSHRHNASTHRARAQGTSGRT